MELIDRIRKTLERDYGIHNDRELMEAIEKQEFPVTLYLGYKVFLSEDDAKTDEEEYREEEHSYGKNVNRRVS